MKLCKQEAGLRVEWSEGGICFFYYRRALMSDNKRNKRGNAKLTLFNL